MKPGRILLPKATVSLLSDKMDAEEITSLISTVLTYWFGPLDQAPKTNSPLWWGAKSQVDADISDKFKTTIEKVSDLCKNEQIDALLATGQGALTAVILLDQMPRNIW